MRKIPHSWREVVAALLFFGGLFLLNDGKPRTQRDWAFVLLIGSCIFRTDGVMWIIKNFKP